MADELSFEDAIKGASATPSSSPGEVSFENALGTGPSATPPSLTPKTDQALAQTTGGLQGFLRRPSPAWLRRFEDPARRFLSTPARPSAADIQAGARWLGIPDQPGFGARQAAGFYEAGRQIATPANAIMTAAMAAQPETIPYLAPAMITPMVSQLPGKLRRVASGQATPEEASGAAADVAMLATPAVHFALPKPLYPELPTGRTTELSPYQWHKRYGVPGPPVPGPGTEFHAPGERGFVGIPTGPKPEEAVGEPIVQGGETHAEEPHETPGQVPAVEGQPAVGGAAVPTEAGDTRDTSAQPMAAAERPMAAEAAPTKTAQGVEQPPIISPTGTAKKPEEMTAAELRSYLSREFWDKQSLAPNDLIRLLKAKEDAPPAPAPPPEKAEIPEPVPAGADKRPLRELLSPEDRSEYQHLVDRWAALDLEGGRLINDPKNPRAWQIADEQNKIKQRMHAIQSKLPDGDVYDVISIGAGATGGTTGLHGGAENLKTVVLEHMGGRGTASAETPRYSNVKGAPSPLGQAGSARDLIDRLAAERMGTEFQQISDIESYDYDPKTKIWTVKTKGLGQGGSGGQTLRGRILSFATGTRPRGAPFELRDAQGNVITDTQLGQKGRTVHLDNARGMRVEAGPGGAMGAVGAANSSAQGAVAVADEPNSGVFHIVARGPDLRSVSDYLLPSMKLLKEQGKLQVHYGSTVDHVEAPSPANGNNYVIVTKRTPPTRMTPEELATLPDYERIPVKSVGSFIGGVPNTSILPKDFLLHPRQRGDPLSGLVRTDENQRPLRLNAEGKEEPIPGAFVGGSLRAAEGVNRMATAEGEGSRVVALALDDLAKMRNEGLMPAWKHEFRQTLQNLGSLTDEPPVTPPKVGPVAKETGPRPFMAVGGKVVTKPPAPRPPSAKTAAELAEHAGGVVTQQQQQEERQGLPVTRFPVSEPQTGPAPSTDTHLLIEKQKTNPGPLTDNDRVLLDQHQDQLRTQYETIANDQLNAYTEGDNERIAENDQKLSETLDRFADLNNARKKAGEPELPHPQEQFSVEAMLKAKRAVNKGRELTPFEMNDVVRWSNLIKEKRDAMDAYRAGPESRGYWDELRKRAEAFRTGVGPKKSLLPDPRNLSLQADLVRAQKDWERSLETDRKAGLTWYQKAPDYLLKWRRAFAISSPRSLAKLGAAAMEGMFLLPARELVGSGLKHLPLVSEVASRAPREGQGFNIRAESEALTQTFKNLISDAGKNLKGQKPDYEMVFGKVDQLPPELQNYVGYLHGALKSPLARDEFTRSFQTISEFEARHGADLTDPLVQMHIGQKAMESSVFWRLQNKNMASRIYRQVNASLERQGDIGKVASVALQAEFPIVTVPSNFLARTFEGVFGAEKGMAELGRAYARGIETLKPEQADLIMRNLKTGSLGTALMLLGVFAPEYFGGYYRPGGKKGQEDPSAPKFGGTKIGDYEVPSYIQDNPFVALPQFGATTTQVGNSLLRKRDEDPAGMWLGLWSAIYGAASSQPFVRESMDIAKAGDPRTAGDVIGDHARSYVIPQLVQYIAEQADPADKRYPRGFTERMMMGIPGLREEVPDVVPKPQQLGVRRKGLLPRRPSTTVRVRR